MSATRLILVGGFLGAGKTTLLGEAAKRLIARGRKVGLITNDQAPDLVDSQFLTTMGFNVEEVAGSCFCCNFQGLMSAADKLLSGDRDKVLIGEPVGSCTDLSATILQPIKQRYSQEFELAPLSVLVDPMRLEEILNGQTVSLHPSAAYIVYKQLEEADWIVVNKTDLLTQSKRSELAALIDAKLPGRKVFWLSAQTGEGLDDWLDSALLAHGAGQRVVEVDYDTYAEGEAVLGWLNASIEVRTRKTPSDWKKFCVDFMQIMELSFESGKNRIGHVKTLLTHAGEHVVSNLTRTQGPVSVRGQVNSESLAAHLVVNAHVEMSPEQLEHIVRRSLDAAAGKDVEVHINQVRSLSPGRPTPTHRFTHVVS